MLLLQGKHRLRHHGSAEGRIPPEGPAADGSELKSRTRLIKGAPAPARAEAPEPCLDCGHALTAGTNGRLPLPWTCETEARRAIPPQRMGRRRTRWRSSAAVPPGWRRPRCWPGPGTGRGLRADAVGRPEVPARRARRPEPDPQRARSDFLRRYHPAGSLTGAIEAFPPDALRAWCDGLGEPTFVGSSGRVFPKAFKASPLLRAWLRRLDGLGVRIRTRHRCVAYEDGTLVFETPEGKTWTRPKAVLLALGGASWPRLGSDGGWVPMLEGLGVAVAPLRPANAASRSPGRTISASASPAAAQARSAWPFGGRDRRGEALITARRPGGRRDLRRCRAPLRDAIEATVGAAALDLTCARTQRRALADRSPDAARPAPCRQPPAQGARPVAGRDRAAARGGAATHCRRPGAAGRADQGRAVRASHGMAPIERAISTAGGIALRRPRRRASCCAGGRASSWPARCSTGRRPPAATCSRLPSRAAARRRRGWRRGSAGARG